MSARTSHADYEARVRRVLEHVHAHLDAPLDLNRLADIACLSPYHWHRVYLGLQGETVHATVTRLRLQRAAKLLIRGELSLQRIACMSGYSAVPPFARAFKTAYGLSPGRYRNCGAHAPYRERVSSSDGPASRIEVRDEPGYRCVAVPHTGRYLEVDRAFSELFLRLARAGMAVRSMGSLGVYFDDPNAVAESRLESLACAIGVPEDADIDALERYDVPSGPHAVLAHRGPYDALEDAYGWLFGHWLPESGHEPADAPVYELYLNDPRDTPPMKLRVDICLPLVSHLADGP